VSLHVNDLDAHFLRVRRSVGIPIRKPRPSPVSQGRLTPLSPPAYRPLQYMCGNSGVCLRTPRSIPI
jgi:hypothetical protein